MAVTVDYPASPEPRGAEAVKHVSGRRYGCPCNQWADACGTCLYALMACQRPGSFIPMTENQLQEAILAADVSRVTAKDPIGQTSSHFDLIQDGYRGQYTVRYDQYGWPVGGTLLEWRKL